MMLDNSHEPQLPMYAAHRSHTVGVFRCPEEDTLPELKEIVAEAWQQPLPSVDEFLMWTRSAAATAD